MWTYIFRICLILSHLTMDIFYLCDTNRFILKEKNTIFLFHYCRWTLKTFINFIKEIQTSKYQDENFNHHFLLQP